MQTLVVYRYGELSQQAKERAIEWYRESELPNATYDVAEVAWVFRKELEGLGYPTEQVYFNLNNCQGDGMAFYGFCSVEKLAGRLLSGHRLRSLHHFLSQQTDIDVEITRNYFGEHYSHWNTMSVDLTWHAYAFTPTSYQVETFSHFEWLIKEDVRETSRRLEQKGYDILDGYSSDESIDAYMQANQHMWLFEEAGSFLKRGQT
jgi:hypothetical protein